MTDVEADDWEVERTAPDLIARTPEALDLLAAGVDPSAILEALREDAATGRK